jgi:hypothetical protein
MLSGSTLKTSAFCNSFYITFEAKLNSNSQSNLPEFTILNVSLLIYLTAVSCLATITFPINKGPKSNIFSETTNFLERKHSGAVGALILFILVNMLLADETIFGKSLLDSTMTVYFLRPQ